MDGVRMRMSTFLILKLSLKKRLLTGLNSRKSGKKYEGVVEPSYEKLLEQMITFLVTSGKREEKPPSQNLIQDG